MEETGARVKVRPLAAQDVEAVLAIQGLCPEIAQWSLWDYDRVARGEMAGWVAAQDAEHVAGFLVARRIANDLEILNFAVHPQMRRRGFGEALLGEAMAWGKSFHAETALLEVRASNFAALAFYQRHDFHLVGKRPKYYTAPIEDALLLIAGMRGS